MLLKGGSNRSADLIGLARRVDQKAKGGRKRNSATLWIVNVHKAKHIFDARARRIEVGPGRIHLPRDYEERWLDEMTAEELTAGKWVKRRARNESLDLEIYAWLALVKPPFAQSRDHMRWVPSAFRIIETVAVIEAALPTEDNAPAPVPAPAARHSEKNKRRARRGAPVRRTGWIKRK